MSRHLLQVRVYYEDTDAGGIVYHTSYLRFAERARTEMLRAKGFEHAELFKTQGIAFTVRHMEVDFQAPARLDDLLEVCTSLLEITGASVTLLQEISCRNQALVTLKVRLACVNLQGRAVRLPSEFRAVFGE